MNAPTATFDQIEWRVDSKPFERNGSHSCRYVPYLDAAGVAAMLDAWVGPFNWSDRYEHSTFVGKPALICVLSVRETKDDAWVGKTDVGVPSNSSPEKGMLSDAFKRAATLKWGVGRNVYEMPTVWAPCDVDNKGNARPNKQTMGGIKAALAQAGVNVEGEGRAREADEEETRPAPATKERVKEVSDLAKQAGIVAWVQDQGFGWPWSDEACNAIERKAADVFEAENDGTRVQEDDMTVQALPIGGGV